MESDVLNPSKPALQAAPRERHSYGQILKSSVLIGGSSVLRIGLGIVRTKAIALILGPGGVGLLGLYNSILELAQGIAGMGINSSGVRQIAEAAGTGNEERVSRTVTTLRRVALILGALGALLLTSLCVPISRLSFGDDSRAASVALLGLAVFFGAVSGGQIALVQGMRRIRDLAAAQALGGIYGTVLTIAVIYFFKERGIVASLVCVAAAAMGTSWWYSRKVGVKPFPMRYTDVAEEVKELLKLGFVFMAVAMMSLGVAYLVRIMVLRGMGKEAAGFYQAAWALGGLYVGIILHAMGADFYPRLTAVSRDNPECNRLVNEQAEVSLLLAGPGVLATLTFAPFVIRLFYSSSFAPAGEILRWICLGMMLRVASWPMGFILLAKGARKPYFWGELVTSVVHVVLVWYFLRTQGLNGTGVAFFGGYLFYWFLIYFIVRNLSGFRWSASNRRTGAAYGIVIAAVFAAHYCLPNGFVMALGGVAVLGTGVHSLRRLGELVADDRYPKWLRKMLYHKEGKSSSEPLN